MSILKEAISPFSRGYNLATKGTGSLFFVGAPTLAGGVIGAVNGLDSDTSLQQTIAGAALGSVALPAIGAGMSVGYHATNNAKAIGKAGLEFATSGAAISRGLYQSTKIASNGSTLSNIAANIKNPLGNVLGIAKKVTGSLVADMPVRNALGEQTGSKMRFTKWGKAAIGATALANAMFDGKREYEQSRMGIGRTEILTASAKMPSYLNNGGATGDLVFALNDNRRG